jgi:hypothetical protein
VEGESEGIQFIVVVGGYPRFNPRAGDPSFLLLPSLDVEKLGLIDDDLIHSHIIYLFLFYLYQLRYFRTLPPNLGFGRAVFEPWDLLLLSLGCLSLKYL